MREGNLVRVRGSNRLWVTLLVNHNDIRNGMNVKQPGIYLFGGMWYGRDPNNKASFGKIISARGVVVGNVRKTRKLSGLTRFKLL